MDRLLGRSAAWALVFVFLGSLPAFAIPVQAPFGSDSMPKAILFTGTSKPTSSSDSGTIHNILRGNSATAMESGALMTPIGDGSYACTAAVFPGASYTYYFSYRIKEYDFTAGDSRVSWYTTAPNDGRTTADNAKAKTITIPSTATHGYTIYNAWGDQTVLGRQGIDGALSSANPYLTADTVGTDFNLTVVSSSGDTSFANYGGENAYGFDAVQTGDSAFTLTWEYQAGLGQNFLPTVDGARRFGPYAAGARSGGSSQYGYRIWRSDSPTGGIVGAVFVDRTTAILGTDTNWSDNNEVEYDATTSITDTSMPDTVSTFLYLVTWYNAYGHYQNDTTRQNFSGGYDTVTRSPAIRVFFIVEHYDENVVFPNGEGQKEGKVYLTPYIDGVRRPDLRQPATVVRVQRNITG
ncbi:MAG: hypothetical protein AAB229_07710 [Candidatus Hydrogenedentota bacterium]